MTNGTRAGIVLLALAQGLAGCGDSGSPATPSAPSVVPSQPPPQPALPVNGGMKGLVVDTAD